MGKRLNLAQRGDSMFERNVAHQARHLREVVVTLRYGEMPASFARAKGRGADGVEPGKTYTGFWAGMDEGFVQLCRTDNQRMVLIDRAAIGDVGETGRTLRGMEDALARIEDEGEYERAERKVDRLHAMCDFFRNTATAALGSVGGLRDARPPA